MVFFLSNGPGDPAAMPNVIKEVKKITNDGRPVFGICLDIKQLHFLKEYPLTKCIMAIVE